MPSTGRPGGGAAAAAAAAASPAAAAPSPFPTAALIPQMHCSMWCTCCTRRSLELGNINRCAGRCRASAAAAALPAVATHCPLRMSTCLCTPATCCCLDQSRAAHSTHPCCCCAACRGAALLPRRRAHAAAPPPRPPPLSCRAARARARPSALGRGRAPARADQCGACCVRRRCRLLEDTDRCARPCGTRRTPRERCRARDRARARARRARQPHNE